MIAMHLSPKVYPIWVSSDNYEHQWANSELFVSVGLYLFEVVLGTEALTLASAIFILTCKAFCSTTEPSGLVQASSGTMSPQWYLNYKSFLPLSGSNYLRLHQWCVKVSIYWIFRSNQLHPFCDSTTTTAITASTSTTASTATTASTTTSSTVSTATTTATTTARSTASTTATAPTRTATNFAAATTTPDDDHPNSTRHSAD